MTQVARSGNYQVIAFARTAELKVGDIIAGVVESHTGEIEVVVLRRGSGRPPRTPVARPQPKTPSPGRVHG